MSEIEIKKVAEKALKTADNLGIATEKAKGITLKAKEKVSESVSDNSESLVNYAIDRVQDNAKNVSEDAIYLFNKQGKKSVNETVKNTKKLEQSIEEVRAKRKIKKDKSKVNNPDRYTPKASDDTVKTDDIASKNTPMNSSKTLLFSILNLFSRSLKTILHSFFKIKSCSRVFIPFFFKISYVLFKYCLYFSSISLSSFSLAF